MATLPVMLYSLRLTLVQDFEVLKRTHCRAPAVVRGKVLLENGWGHSHGDLTGQGPRVRFVHELTSESGENRYFGLE